MWIVILHAEFSEWLDGLSENEQDRILSALEVLEQYGPNLSRPKADTIKVWHQFQQNQLIRDC